MRYCSKLPCSAKSPTPAYPGHAQIKINLAFSCNDPGTSKTFYIDNILIKDLGASITVQTNTVVNEDFSGTSYPWVASHSAITYTLGVMRVSGTSGTAPYNVSHNLGLLPGQIYKVRLTVAGSPSLAGGNLSFGFDSNDGTSGQDFTQAIGTSAGTYTFYVIPKAVENTFYINLNSPSGSFSFDIDNFIIEMGQTQPKPLYTAVANDITDYYAFGAPMPGRLYHLSVPNKYRYSFNGKENDSEVYGDGNELDYGMRIYDPRLSRFLSVDPLTNEYPWYTPYQFAGNKPIWALDLDGLEELFINNGTNANGQEIYTYRRNPNATKDDKGKVQYTYSNNPSKNTGIIAPVNTFDKAMLEKFQSDPGLGYETKTAALRNGNSSEIKIKNGTPKTINENKAKDKIENHPIVEKVDEIVDNPPKEKAKFELKDDGPPTFKGGDTQFQSGKNTLLKQILIIKAEYEAHPQGYEVHGSVGAEGVMGGAVKEGTPFGKADKNMTYLGEARAIFIKQLIHAIAKVPLENIKIQINYNTDRSIHLEK